MVFENQLKEIDKVLNIFEEPYPSPALVIFLCYQDGHSLTDQ